MKRTSASWLCAGLLVVMASALLVAVGWWLSGEGAGRDGPESQAGSEAESEAEVAPGAETDGPGDRDPAGAEGSASQEALAQRAMRGAVDPRSLDPSSSSKDGPLEEEMWSFFGRLLSETRRPLGGVTVRVSVPGEWIGMPEEECAATVSDLDGAFRLQLPRRPRCRRLRLGVEPSDRVWLSQVLSMVGQDRWDLGTWIVPRGGKIHGGVFGPGGRAVPGAKVVIRPKSGRDRGRIPVSVRVVHADGAGRFVAEAVGAGEVSLAASAPGFLGGSVQGVRVELDAPAEPIAVFLAEGSLLEGRVVDEQGAAVPAARVAPLLGPVIPGDRGDDRKAAVTDEQGWFRVDQISDAPLILRVEAPGCVPLTTSALRPGEQDVRLVVQRSGEIVGRVVDEEGMLLGDLSLSLHRNAFFDIEAQGDFATVLQGVDCLVEGEGAEEATGRFVLRDILHDHLHLLCEVPGHVAVMAGPLEAPPGTVTETCPYRKLECVLEYPITEQDTTGSLVG